MNTADSPERLLMTWLGIAADPAKIESLAKQRFHAAGMSAAASASALPTRVILPPDVGVYSGAMDDAAITGSAFLGVSPREQLSRPVPENRETPLAEVTLPRGLSGKYSELLPCGGELQIWSHGWQIHYYFPGPDLRYNGTLVEIPGKDVEEYARSFEQNWEDYQRLRIVMAGVGNLERHGMCGMIIRVGGFADGVCLRGYHMPISTIERLRQVVDGFRCAIARAHDVQRLFQ